VQKDFNGKFGNDKLATRFFLNDPQASREQVYYVLQVGTGHCQQKPAQSQQNNDRNVPTGIKGKRYQWPLL